MVVSMLIHSPERPEFFMPKWVSKCVIDGGKTDYKTGSKVRHIDTNIIW